MVVTWWPLCFRIAATVFMALLLASRQAGHDPELHVTLPVGSLPRAVLHRRTMRALHWPVQIVTVRCTISHRGLTSRTGGWPTTFGRPMYGYKGYHMPGVVSLPAPTMAANQHHRRPLCSATRPSPGFIVSSLCPPLCRAGLLLQVAIEPSKSVTRRPSRRVVPMSPCDRRCKVAGAARAYRGARASSSAWAN